MSIDPVCFVIMPIGHPSTEKVWTDVYLPTILECGFVADRIDETEDGSELPPLIMQKIVNANLVIADLTFERPNCYFELGYAYGVPSLTETAVIVCCREDHYHRSKDYRSDGHQVHFDLNSRNIIFWKESNPEKLKTELRTKISRRMQIIRESQKAISQEPSQEAAVPSSIVSFATRLGTQAGTALATRLQRAQKGVEE